MQQPSQQFMWFLIARLDAIKAMRAALKPSNPLVFVYTDISIQVLESSAPAALKAAMLLQPTAHLGHHSHVKH